MLTHSVGVASDVDDVAVVQDAVDERGSHHLVSKHLAPFLKAFVGGHHGGGVLVAAAHELEEQHGPGLADRQVADLIHDHQGGGGQDCQTTLQRPRGSRFLQRGDQVRQGAVVYAAATLGGSDCQPDCQMGFADPWGAQQHHVLFALQEAELCQAVDLLPLDRRLEGEVELFQGLYAGSREERIAACNRRLFLRLI